jgi:hypothetical protein
MLPKASFVAKYCKSWISQISLLMYINFMKLINFTHLHNLQDALNIFVEHNYLHIDDSIDSGIYKHTEINNILYSIHKPLINKYDGNIILFIGGRNGITLNSDFSERLSEYLNIPVATFQYSGYYKSGKNNFLCETSYIESVQEVYNMLLTKYNIHIIGYSLGCYGAYIINKYDSIFLISPFYSLERSLRSAIEIKQFNLAKELEKKFIKKIYVNTFHGDLINPIWHLDGPFRKSNVIMKGRFGNHISGLSNILFEDIKVFLNESIMNLKN